MPHARGNLLKCREPSASRAPAYATALVMGAGFVFSMAMCWPGHLSYDSLVQLLEGRTGVYSGWHPPAMSWLLGVSDWLLPGAGVFVAVTALIFFLSLFSLLWVVRRPAWTAPVIVALCLLTPQVVLYQGIVWKDVLFANATVAGFVAQAHLARIWKRPAWRFGLIALSFLFLVLAGITRQNGAIMMLAGAGSLLWIWRRQTESWRAGVYGSGAVLALSTLIALAATAALNMRLVPDAGVSRQLKRLELYDLIGGLATDAKLPLNILQQKDPALLHLMRSDGVRLYSPVRSDFLARSAPLQTGLEQVPDAVLRNAWLDLIAHDPADYLHARAKAFRWVTLTPNISLCVPYVVGLRGPPQTMESLGFHTRFSWRDEFADAYGKLFVHTPIFSHIIFIVLMIAELGFLIWRRRTQDISMIAMLCGAIAFAFSFFFISLACDYRYDYVLDLAALAVLIYVALDPQRARSGADDLPAPPLTF
ncbi:MAG TPA: hypothetical protein VLC74_03630 [Rhizomicrobium sp.]|nr:hypothetical protein [Rhizomicrobium sp.]